MQNRLKVRVLSSNRNFLQNLQTLLSGTENIDLTGNPNAELTISGEPDGVLSIYRNNSEKPAGRISSSSDVHKITTALWAVSHGLTVDDPEIRSHNNEEKIGTTMGKGITPREKEILIMLSGGHPNKFIASQLGISENTVKFHVNGIMQKLDAQSRTEAVIIAARKGIIPL